MLTISGACMGVKTNDRTDRDSGEVTTRYFIGVAVPKVDGFEGELEIFEIKIPDDDYTEKLHEHFDSLKRKQVSIAIVQSSWSMGSRHGISSRLLSLVSVDGKPVEKAA